MAQFEVNCVALYGGIVKFLTYNNINSGELRIIDQYEVTKDTNMPRKISDVDLITTTGSECLRISTLEFQCLFMGNNMEVLFGDDEPSI